MLDGIRGTIVIIPVFATCPLYSFFLFVIDVAALVDCQ